MPQTGSGSYLSYYEPRSPLIQHYRKQPEGHVHALGDYAFSATYRETEYFQDWVRPQGFADMIGGHLVRTQQHYAWLSLRRAEQRGTYSPSDIRAANRVARHLGRVITLRFKLEMERNITNGLRDFLELVGFGVWGDRGSQRQSAHRELRSRDNLEGRRRT